MKKRLKINSDLQAVGSLFRIGWSHCSKPEFLALQCTVLLYGIVWSSLTVAQQFFIDTVAKGAETGSIRQIITGIVAVGIAFLTCQVVTCIYDLMNNHAFMHGYINMLGALQCKASAIDPSHFEDQRQLDAFEKANTGIEYIQDVLYGTPFVILHGIGFFGTLFIYLYSISSSLALVIPLIFIPSLAVRIMTSRERTKLENEVTPLRRKASSYEKALISRNMMTDTRQLGAVKYFLNLLEDTLHSIRKLSEKSRRHTICIEFISNVIVLLGYIGILLLSFSKMMNGEISVGVFTALFASVGRFFSIMENDIKRFQEIIEGTSLARYFVNFLEIRERQSSTGVDPVENNIQLENVCYCYPGSDKNAINNVTVKLKAGETMAIVGENGSGKSTLVRLLTGLYLPTSGTVTRGGLDTKDMSLAQVRNGVSAAFQRFQRYPMNLRDNIIISDITKEASDADLDKIALQAGLDARDTCYPEMYDTLLARSLGGVDLSGGQWQRIAIARALFRTNDLIILDEPTATIDPLEETRVFKQFYSVSRGKTALIVTHRLGSVQFADRIIVLKNGCIVEDGKHKDLIRQNGEYAHMFEAQRQWYITS